MPVYGEPLPERQFSARADLSVRSNFLNKNEPIVIGNDLAGRDIHPDAQAERQKAWESYKQKLAARLIGQLAVRKTNQQTTKAFPIPGFYSWQEVYDNTTYVASTTEIPEPATRLVLVDQNEKTA